MLVPNRPFSYLGAKLSVFLLGAKLPVFTILVPNCPTTYYITSSWLQARLLDHPDITKKMIGNRPNTYTFTKVGCILLMLKMFCKRVISIIASILWCIPGAGWESSCHWGFRIAGEVFCICPPSYISHICFLAFPQIDISDNPSAYSAFYLDISHFWQYLSESVQMYFCTFVISFAWSIRGSFLSFIPNTFF